MNFIKKWNATASIVCKYIHAAIYAVFFIIFTLTFSLRSVAQVNAEMVTLMGRNALSVDDYLTAIRYFNQAIEAKPYLSRPYYYRAYAKFTLEDYKGAETDCTKSIELNPFIVEVYQLRGLCRIHNENFNGAIEDYSRVLYEIPNEQGSLYNRALCYLQNKNYEKADSDLTVMLRHYPRYYRTYLVKTQVALELKDTTRAMQYIDTLLVKNPKEGNGWSFKGRYAMQNEDYHLADSCFTQAIKYLPRDFDNYILRAQARHALDKFGLAIADYDRAIELQPQHFVAHYNRGLLRSFVGDLNRAIEDFDFIISVEPNNILAIYNRAQLREKTGNFRGSIADYSRIIKEYPNFYAGYIARAECKRKIGDTKGAIADESIIARRNLDLVFGKNRTMKKKKVRLRSEHELDQYQQLIEEESSDTVRNVFGTLYGKVQNEKVSSELMSMYSIAFRTTFVRGYHSIGFSPELSKLIHTNTNERILCLTAEFDATAAQDAEEDALRLEKIANNTNPFELALARSAVAMARYDYNSALNEVNQAIKADTTSLLALMQRAFILSRSVAASTLEASDVRSRMALATSDLKRASHLATNNAYVAYNLGCLYAQQNANDAAIEQFSLAIALDSNLPEAYYNRALLYIIKGEKEKATDDFSHAGQLGLYKAYAQIKQENKTNK